jgi:hypothetical protein
VVRLYLAVRVIAVILQKHYLPLSFTFRFHKLELLLLLHFLLYYAARIFRLSHPSMINANLIVFIKF